jgi:hypothetical protein
MKVTCLLILLLAASAMAPDPVGPIGSSWALFLGYDQAPGPHTNVDNHVKFGQAFLGLPQEEFLSLSEVPALDRVAIRAHSEA